MILSRQQRLQNATQPTAAPSTFPPPINGWNTRDQLDAMDPNDAVLLDNWFPDGNGVAVRAGYTAYASGLGTGQVRTMAQFDNGAVQKFIATCGGNFYDVSNPGPVGAPLGTGFINNDWQTTNFLNRLFFCNGHDTVQVYDGTMLADAAFTPSADWPDMDLTKMVGIAQYQQRLFLWEQESPGFWYAELNSMSGDLNFYDLSAFSPAGGSLVAMTTITHDGGNGVLDIAAFMLSSGDTFLFYGNDPAQISGWQLVGRYRLSPPVSPRAVCTYGGDSFITTYDDHIPLEQQMTALKIGALAPRSKISTAVQQAIQLDKAAFGWQAIYYPRGRRLLFNIPNPDGTFHQHVCNTGLPTQPWCRFTGMNAFCWSLFDDLLYFGAAGGNIYLADNGVLDAMGPVKATAQQAWNKLGSPGRKRVSASRPLLQSAGAIAYTFKVGFDYAPLDIQIPIVTAGGLESAWNTSPWNTSPWSPDISVDSRWRIGGGSGAAVSFGIAIAAVQSVSWLRTDMRLEGGDGL